MVKWFYREPSCNNNGSILLRRQNSHPRPGDPVQILLHPSQGALDSDPGRTNDPAFSLPYGAEEVAGPRRAASANPPSVGGCNPEDRDGRYINLRFRVTNPAGRSIRNPQGHQEYRSLRRPVVQRPTTRSRETVPGQRVVLRGAVRQRAGRRKRKVHL